MRRITIKLKAIKINITQYNYKIYLYYIWDIYNSTRKDTINSSCLYSNLVSCKCRFNSIDINRYNFKGS